jgi:colicin import membrane protein
MSTADTVETASEVVDAKAKGAVTPLDPLKKIEAGLAVLKGEQQNFDLTTAAGEKAARVYRAKCVSLRTAIDEAYDTVNRPLLTIQRDARALRDEVKDGVKKLEDPVDKAIKEVEAARELERIRKAELEAARIAGLHERIDAIKAIAARAVGKPSAEIEQKIQLVVGMTIDDKFQELKPAAEQAQAATLATLRELLAAALVQEDDARRLAEERIELARRQAEQAERERAERERVAAEQRAAQARIDEQRAAIAREEAEARQRREAADREAAAAREAADREARERREAEELRIANERAALRREQEERDRQEREATEARQRAEREAAEAEERARREAAEAEERRQAEIRAEARRQEELAAIADKRVRDAAPLLLSACKAQHEAIDWLLACVVKLDKTFMPTKSQVWPACRAGAAAIAAAEGVSDAAPAPQQKRAAKAKSAPPNSSGGPSSG